MTINILCVGKLRNAAIHSLCEDYHRRCRSRFTIERHEFKTLTALKAKLPQRGTLVAFDERGDQYTSREFAERLDTWLGNGPLSLAIGGADGLDDAVLKRASEVVSLGKLTFAHRLVHLLVAEQLYRAYSLLSGSPYHRD